MPVAGKLALAASAASLLFAVGAVEPPSVGAATPSANSATLSFGAYPVPLPNGTRRAFFALSMSPGQSAEETVIVTNAASRPASLLIGPARGITSPDSGFAYAPPTSPCSGTACWLTGVPSQLAVPPPPPGKPRGQVPVSFTVHVPGGTLPGQYLAGVTIWPASSAASVVGHPKQGVTLRSRLDFEVTVGVAVTVGPAADMAPALRILGVSAHLPELPSGSGAFLLDVVEKDTGNTFDFPVRGLVYVRGGRGGTSRELGMSSSTVLPGGVATLQLNAPGLGSGVHSVLAKLWYDNGKKVAVWSGMVVFPKTTVVKVFHRGGTTIVVPTSSGVPTWLVLLATGLGVLFLLAAGLLVALLWRRRDRRDDHPPRGPGEGPRGGARGAGPTWPAGAASPGRSGP